MGLPKATLPFGAESMLARVARLLGDAVDRLILVASPHQDLPPLQAAVPIEIVHDRFAGRGPLEGLYVGLSALPAETEAAYVTGCDVPLLATDFVRRMFHMLGAHAIAVPKTDGYFHPLAAVYRPSVVDEISRLIDDHRMRAAYLFERASTRVVTAEELRDTDPQLLTLNNLNRPEDYFAALAAAGIEPRRDIVAALRNESWPI